MKTLNNCKEKSSRAVPSVCVRAWCSSKQDDFLPNMSTLLVFRFTASPGKMPPPTRHTLVALPNVCFSRLPSCSWEPPATASAKTSIPDLPWSFALCNSAWDPCKVVVSSAKIIYLYTWYLNFVALPSIILARPCRIKSIVPLNRQGMPHGMPPRTITFHQRRTNNAIV